MWKLRGKIRQREITSWSIFNVLHWMDNLILIKKYKYLTANFNISLMHLKNILEGILKIICIIIILDDKKEKKDYFNICLKSHFISVT